MISQHLLNAIEENLAKELGNDISIQKHLPVGGGCINSGGKIVTNKGDFFVKYNDERLAGMFETEVKGLKILSKTNEIKAPEVISIGNSENITFLILEWIEPGRKKNNFWEDFGSRLANLHRHLSESYGLDFDNYIGSLPQYNKRYDSWIDFFVHQRIEKQLEMASAKYDISEISSDFQELTKRLHDIFPDEPPSLLHGDLWSGNFLVNDSGYAAIIDPAVYYGHREIELAFTKLFGGFDNTFYNSYEESYPVKPNFGERIDIYNLYPLLVHANLFGTSYLNQVRNILKKFT